VHNERQRLGRPTHLGWMLRWLVNRRRLAVPLAISLGCHLTGAWLVRIEPPLVFTAPPPAVRVRYVPEDRLVAAGALDGSLLTLEDPTLLSLPHGDAFSRNWLARRPRAAQRLLEWRPPGLEFEWPVAARRELPAEAAEAAAPRGLEPWVPGLLEPALELPVETAAPARLARVEWAPPEWGVSGLTLAGPPSTPGARQMTAAATRYRVAADRWGQVRYVLVDRSCGDPVLDRWGAQELRRQRLSRAAGKIAARADGAGTGEGAEIEWGSAVVLWPALPGEP